MEIGSKLFIGALITYWFFIAQLDLMYFLYKGIQSRLSKYPSDWKFKDLSFVDKLWLLAFVVIDWWVNMTSMTIRFFELPEHCCEIMTTRLKRWRSRYHGYRPSQLTITEWHRKTFAIEVCTVLDEHSPHGSHC